MSQDNGGRRLISDYLYQYQEHMEELFWDGSRLKKKQLKKLEEIQNVTRLNKSLKRKGKIKVQRKKGKKSPKRKREIKIQRKKGNKSPKRKGK